MTTARGEVLCPSCGHGFDSITSVMCHLNNPRSSCARWFISKDQAPFSQPPVDQDPAANAHFYPSTRGTSMKYPFAGHVFGRSRNFMDNFHTDKFSEERASHPYYPFASSGEWELASFLSRADLSMKFIDEFLSLELVSFCYTHSY